jgi:hypothetical protein
MKKCYRLKTNRKKIHFNLKKKNLLVFEKAKLFFKAILNAQLNLNQGFHQ